MISVIIPAYNCADEIGALLDCIQRTRLPEVEILVVDDASTDGTVAVCANRPGVHVVRQPVNRGPAAARNAGAAQAAGDILVFVDSDVLLPDDRDVLAEMIEAFRRDPDIDCVSTLSHVQPRVPSAIAYNNSIYHDYYMDRFLGGRDERKGVIMFFTTRLGAIRTRRFRQSGGFQEALTTVMNEDGEFGTRVFHQGFVSYFNRRFVNLHRYPTTFDRFARSYFLTALVQAQINQTWDTSADQSISGVEKLRRLFACTAFGLPVLALFGVTALVTGVGAWVAAFLALFGGMSRRIWRHVPARYRLTWYLVYIAISPLILAGYAAGLALHWTGRSRIGGRPSALPFFDESGPG